MDLITLTMAKKYTDSQRLVEPAEVLSWNGEYDESELLDGYYLLSTKDYDLDNLESITVVFAGTPTEVPKSSLVFGEYDGIRYATTSDALAEFCLTVPGVGLVVLAGVTWVSEVKFAASTIDPKYLPGVCLPVVELSTMPTADGAACTDEENAALDAVIAGGVPPLVKILVGDVSLCIVSSFAPQGILVTNMIYVVGVLERIDTGWAFFDVS